MECGVAMLAGNWWAGLLTWVAFAVVVTAAVTFVAARRHPGSGPLPLFPSMKSGACRTGSRNSPGVSIRWSAPPRLTPPEALPFSLIPTARCSGSA